MIAWVWPAETVRLTPRKTSRASPAASVTLACRSRISRVDFISPDYLSLQALLAGARGLRQRDVYVVALNPDGIRGHRLGGRRPGGLARPHVEARAVQPAL